MVQNKNSAAGKCQGVQEEQTSAEVPAWKACQAQGSVPDPGGAGGLHDLFCFGLVCFCFLSRDVHGGRGVLRNTIWH